MKQKLIQLAFLSLILGTTAFAQSTEVVKRCKPYLLRVGGGTSSIETQLGCESDNTKYRKLIYTVKQKSPVDSVEVAIDSRNFPESRSAIETAISGVSESGFTSGQNKLLRNNVNPLLKKALASQTSVEREEAISLAKAQLEILLLNK